MLFFTQDLAGCTFGPAPGKGARPSKFTDNHDKTQWAKFRSLPNIL